MGKNQEIFLKTPKETLGSTGSGKNLRSCSKTLLKKDALKTWLMTKKKRKMTRKKIGMVNFQAVRKFGKTSLFPGKNGTRRRRTTEIPKSGTLKT